MPPSGVYSSEQLAMLSQVLDDALKVAVELSDAPLNGNELQDLSAQLGKVIMDHFTAGETDPERLKTIAVKSI